MYPTYSNTCCIKWKTSCFNLSSIIMLDSSIQLLTERTDSTINNQIFKKCWQQNHQQNRLPKIYWKTPKKIISLKPREPSWTNSRPARKPATTCILFHGQIDVHEMLPSLSTLSQILLLLLFLLKSHLSILFYHTILELSSEFLNCSWLF